jgi:glycosyltransferase involved in cell wall biosynthesis
MAFLPSATVRVIPHFVEERVLAANRDDAKRALGLAGFQVVTLLGYIHPRKGHALLIDAMRELPESVVVVLAGKAQPEHAAYLQEIRRAADEAGVSHRLRMTGYLSEAQLNAYLAATDLAVCPFTKVSASGSISTWLSAGRRILASELPQVAEYNAWEPGAIEVFSPYTPSGLASGINRVLACKGERQLKSINLLRERLTISRVLDAHLEIYGQLRSEAAR